MITIELFAGVGGFRLALEGKLDQDGKFKSPLSGYSEDIRNQSFFITGYSNQFEPLEKKTQTASNIYHSKFQSVNHDNRNIEEVTGLDILTTIQNSVTQKRLNEDLILVGGFPCQDYSVANGLKTSKGILGKKGVLWWQIDRIIRELKNLGRQPHMLLLENVDRLLKSPSVNKGRDFAIMLTCLENLGYIVEYKVINAADFGMPQRRRRVFIAAYLKNSFKGRNMLKMSRQVTPSALFELGIISSAFPNSIVRELPVFNVLNGLKSTNSLRNELIALETRMLMGSFATWGNAGILINGNTYSFKVAAKIELNKSVLLLKDVLYQGAIPESFFVNDSEIDKWKSAKSAKRILRINPVGKKYWFAEGNMSLTEELKLPSRTIITSEGGRSASRTKHLIYLDGKYRRLLPIELERLNMFPDNHTLLENVSDVKRAFLMGNALVVGVVERLRNSIISEMYGI